MPDRGELGREARDLANCESELQLQSEGNGAHDKGPEGGLNQTVLVTVLTLTHGQCSVSGSCRCHQEEEP